MILHIDMDAFYASIEQLDHPELQGKCVIVGGSITRGVVSAASYEARKFGVHSAMPIFQARKKCPDGIFVRPRMKRYKEISDRVVSLLNHFSPVVEQVSIDEAYMDISGSQRLLGSLEEIGIQIKESIKEEVNLTCSVGIAPVRFIAKIASDMDKPDGLTIIKPEDVDGFIRNLPIGKVPGVGKVTYKQLEVLGIKFLGEVKRFPEDILIKRLGKYGQRLIKLAGGLGEATVMPDTEHKSVSTERTLSRDIEDKTRLGRYLLKQSGEVARQLRKQDVRARTVTLKIKHADFKQVTRSVTLKKPTQSSDKIYSEAKKLLEKYDLRKKVRLIGVGASGLVGHDIPEQMDLFSEKKKSKNWERVDRAIDSISDKFGKYAVRRAGVETGDNNKGRAKTAPEIDEEKNSD